MGIIRMKTADGGDIYIETDESEESTLSLQRLKEPPKIPSFTEVGQKIATVCSEVHAELERKVKRPKSLTLSFGVKLTGEAGIPLITSSKVEASLTVTAVWDPV